MINDGKLVLDSTSERDIKTDVEIYRLLLIAP